MRNPFLSALLVLCCTLSIAAQEKAKPNTLTPKEITDGWILLFDGDTTFGWKADGSVKVDRGVIQLGAGKRAELLNSTAFAGFEFRAEYGPDTMHASLWACDELTRPGGNHKVTDLLPSKDQAWQIVGLNDRPPSEKDIGGPTGIRFDVNDRGVLKLRNAKLRPIGLKPLFNGKDLAGWKVFAPEKYKSKVTVEDRAIQLVNGPGDLQTEGKYADFVLQLECKSNGKHLNSGVFFRCKPNEYQNGYEAQIHNNFTADPPKDYTVEEYDPQTHKLLEKRKVKSAAVDYGTGAIYRRIPARKEAAKDGEWFTMTIVAQGNHIATWVNGIQQVDWYDNRPASDNPRTGCRLEAGHISIQGHDPTTNLSFRNIRIAELPGKR
jgi:hypothetical protein